ncbi:hypothetical protein FHG87_020957 [Trinorchestia longiramus]|nr:hypothetical protein FHG87_020957 [Trinorchestia longiramus]
MNFSIPYDNATQRYSSCQMYDYNFTEHLADLGLLTPSDEVLAESSNTSFMVMPPSSAQVVPCGEGGWVYQLPPNSTSVVAQVRLQYF